ncbi:extracellular matrix regulator RemB [Niallia sp. Krafla_26]|uniref:extracellular matrix regulator RemB n=1 Tax=Niallia sp. Krafla_26 TaxID=3064703 RepID=UPI003D170B01
MYLDFGLDQVIHANEIIAIIDKKSIESSTELNDLLKRYNHHSIHQPNGTYKSIIITKKQVYFSPFTSNTLKKRSEQGLY